MYIEVTEKTFNQLFGRLEDELGTERTELSFTRHFINQGLEQRGKTILNFVGGITQYYLTDINAYN